MNCCWNYRYATENYWYLARISKLNGINLEFRNIRTPDGVRIRFRRTDNLSKVCSEMREREIDSVRFIIALIQAAIWIEWSIFGSTYNTIDLFNLNLRKSGVKSGKADIENARMEFNFGNGIPFQYCGLQCCGHRKTLRCALTPEKDMFWYNQVRCFHTWNLANKKLDLNFPLWERFFKDTISNR